MSRYLFLIWAALSAALAQSTAVITVDASQKAPYEIPRTIYGTFLEPIGKSIYGGLWAQLLENPSFEENLWSVDNIRRMVEREPALAQSSRMGLPLPWQPLDVKQGWRYEPRWGDAANSSRSLLLMGLPNAKVGVKQQVYPPAHRVRKYEGTLWAKRVSGAGALDVSLRKGSERLAGALLHLAGTSWVKYSFSLELKDGQLARLEPADFVIALEDESRVLIDQALLFPADNVDGMDPDMIAMCKALRSPVIRYGGNFTSGYHWQDGIGPVERRVSMLNQSWGMPEYNHFGTDEFLDFCKRVGAEPQICLNLGTGTPQEAADWVRFVNLKWGRGGSLWELGNELWGEHQIGYPTIERIASRTKEFADAVRAADPTAHLIATGQDPDRFREWNSEQLKLPRSTFEYLSTHFVVGTDGVRRKNPTPEFIADSAFALPVGLERKLREMRTPGVKIAFTEWLFHGAAGRSPRFDTMGGAICTAGFLNTLIRTADFVTLSDMTGLVEFGGVWKKKGQVYGVPAYWAFRMYSTADATTPIATQTESGHYDIDEGNRRIPQIHDVPYLDVVSALNDAGDKLTVFVVNRHRDGPTSAEITIKGFTPSGYVRATTLAASSIYDGNTEEKPEAIKPVETVATMPRYSFPPASVTALTFVSRPPAR